MVEVQPPSDVFGATDVVTVYALGVDDAAIEHLCEQKSPETFRDRGFGGEYRSRTGDLLHAMQAL